MFRVAIMTKIIKVKTGSKFEEIASYSRVVAIDNIIHVSNTAGRNPDSQEISEDVIEQAEQVFQNIERALAAVGASLADVVMSRVFIQNPADTHKVMEFIGTKFRGVDPASTVTCPPLGSNIYKVELEVTAYRGASKAEVETITIAQ
jgi:enamine deaminase RidA (YjgF/YER057c/UK114 family)